MNQNTTAAAEAPAVALLDPNFAYSRAATTDVTLTFKKHGWTEPDRRRQVAMKRLLNQLDSRDDECLDESALARL